jgi:hypothetical protein
MESSDEYLSEEEYADMLKTKSVIPMMKKNEVIIKVGLIS